MKEIYTAPETEIITFSAEDVIGESITGKETYDDFNGNAEITIP